MLFSCAVPEKNNYFVCSYGAGCTGWWLSFVVMWWMVLARGGVCGGGCIVDGLLKWWLVVALSWLWR